MSTLKIVTLTLDFVIAVEPGEQEQVIARDNIQDAVMDMCPWDQRIAIRPYVPGEAVGWHEDCVPYGSDGSKTTREHLLETTG